MTVLIKPGVTWVYAPAVFRILDALKRVSASLKLNLTVTSAADGQHSGPSDPHYTGEALDVRSHDFTHVQQQAVLAALQADLGPAFTMFLESATTPNSHFHCQRRLGTTFTIEDYLA